MSMITIQCRLVALEPVRRHLWHLMAHSNTPLINDLLKQISQHPDFEIWQCRGTISETVVRELCEPLKAVYPGQPQRVYASAILMVTYIYKSWLAIQKRLRYRLNGKQRWLNVVKSDAELLELSGSTLEDLQQQAKTILSELTTEEVQLDPKEKKRKTTQQKPDPASATSPTTHLFAAYEATDDNMSRCAIAYLIKNSGDIPETPEDPEKFAHRMHRKQKEIERLKEQLQARLPKGRDLTGEAFLETLATATKQLPETVAQAREWQDKLSERPATLPYPLIYGSATDVRWGKTAQGRIAVNFSGLEKYLKAASPEIKEWFKTHQEHPFRLYCDQRQLPFFQHFLEDTQAYEANPDTYPAGLLTLSSAMLAWRSGEGKGDPWTVNHLALYCSFDTRLMSAEGTLEVKQEKTKKAFKKLSHANPDPRNQATLDRLQNVPERPSRKPYQGKPEILVGLSIGLASPITAVVVNGSTGEVITIHTARKLLDDHYHLFNRHRQQQRQNALKRHKNQKRGIKEQPSESELGQYVDRLLAKAIIQLAQTYQAGSIVLPNLTHRRELLASEITAKAEQRCPGSVEAQNKYAKEYRKGIHCWSYSRLIEAICCKAQQLGIRIEAGFQLPQGAPQEQAEDVAIAAYHARAIAKI